MSNAFVLSTNILEKQNCYFLEGILKGGIATGYRVESRVRFPAEARFFSSP
jgi:hypothetical protein